LGRERSSLELIVDGLDTMQISCTDANELMELAVAEDDLSTMQDISTEIEDLDKQIALLEFRRMFSGEMDDSNAFIDIQSGAGGTEAQDWAEMMMRMYLRWAESHDYKVEVIEISAGDVAGIKSATIQVSGEYVYGWLRTETGVHRLVRKSPFDSSNKRHTSFASVFVMPEVNDDIEIEIDPSDLRIDVYRASGAGGQHVNTTDSAVRITHLPTNIVVQSSEKSQHQNRANCMAALKSRLYELEMRKRTEGIQEAHDNKGDAGWGNQIRSYVLHPYQMVKDLRTNVETSDSQGVLNGDLDMFMAATLALDVAGKTRAEAQSDN